MGSNDTEDPDEIDPSKDRPEELSDFDLEAEEGGGHLWAKIGIGVLVAIGLASIVMYVKGIGPFAPPPPPPPVIQPASQPAPLPPPSPPAEAAKPAEDKPADKPVEKPATKKKTGKAAKKSKKKKHSERQHVGRSTPRA